MASGNRARGLAIGALVVSALLAGTAAYALDQATDDSAPTALSSPEPVVTESPTAEPTVDPTLAPIPTLSPKSSPTLSATPTESPTSTPTPFATPTPVVTTAAPRKTYSYPKPSTEYEGLSLTIADSTRSGSRSKPFVVNIKAEDGGPGALDGDGTIFFDRIDWGDGVVTQGSGNPTRCKSYPPLYSPPGSYQPEPDGAIYGPFSHRYPDVGARAGYVVSVRVRSVNADCKPNGPRAEAATVTYNVIVDNS